MPENMSVFRIELTHEAVNDLRKLTRWTYFLSILGFVYMGLMVVLGFSFGLIMSSFGPRTGAPTPPSFLFGLIYVVIAIIYFFPILYLYKFSLRAKQSIQTSSTSDFTAALKNLTSHYTYIGILAVIAIAFMLLGVSIAVLISLLK